VFKEMALELPEGSTIHADKGYTDYDHEDFLREVGLKLKSQRKKSSKRPMPAWEEFLGKPVRQYIETVFGQLRACANRRGAYVSRSSKKAIESLLPLSSTKSFQPIGAAS
jgi:hypothetical protein